LSAPTEENSHSVLYEKLQSRLEKDFPKTSALLKDGSLKARWEYLISPFTVEIPKESFQKMEKAVTAFFESSRALLPASAAKNNAVLMSYDFHTSSDGQAKLIEINTNASGYLISCLLLSVHEDSSFFDLKEIALLKRSFVQEMEFVFSKLPAKPHVVIVDDHVAAQKMLIEFYLYKELFEHWGWTAEISEASDLNLDGVDLIYNRTTDFFLDQKEHQVLRSAWKQGLCAVSPQPDEYAALADKNRLLQMQKNRRDLPEAVQQVLLSSYEVGDFKDAEDLWTQRKAFFFKPKNSFGGKSTYRGKSIGHKAFDLMIQQDPLIQELFPPQKWQEWKFDVRCFAYRDQIQWTCGRLYQGQVTNFSTPYGGFCPVRLKS
jgi:hypothetical protein